MTDSAKSDVSYIKRFVTMLLKQVLLAFITLLVVITMTFFLLEASPGKPFGNITETIGEAGRQALYEKHGLDRPLLERYINAFGNLLGDGFGESIIYPGETVFTILRECLGVSFRIGLQQLIIGALAGGLCGAMAAVKRGKVFDGAVLTASVIFISIPSIVMSLILQSVFASLGGLPIMGWPDGGSFFGAVKYTILPTLAGCAYYFALYARLFKASVLDVISQDYIMAARAKGISEFRVIKNHVLKNALIPVVSKLPYSLLLCMTGSLFIERVFLVPGIGSRYFKALGDMDIPVIIGLTCVFALFYLLVLLLTEILYFAADPAIRNSLGLRSSERRGGRERI